GEMRQSSIGLPGERESVYEITYHNNEEISRVLTEENITVEAEPMVIEYGTSLVGTDYVSGEDAYAFGMKTATTAGGVSFAYLETRDIIATGYCYTEDSYETLNVASYGYGTMIVDPQIIPLGSVVYVENYGFAVASGTSEYVVNNSILLGFDTVEQAEAFGTWEGSAYVISIPTL
ncbi:MAG: G5 domain-containing protein, partial [Firmicutes bacterium]|nr:G5 domain-containing protein [Bacillota bacterium]